MKRIVIFAIALMLLFGVSAQAQQAPVQAIAQSVSNFTATGSGSTINLIGTGVKFHRLSWYVVGSLSSCSFTMQTATGSGGSVSFSGGLFGATTQCTSSGEVVATGQVNYLKLSLYAYNGVGSSPNITFVYRGYTEDPSTVFITGQTNDVNISSNGITRVVVGGTARTIITWFGLTISSSGASAQNVKFVTGTGTNCAGSTTSFTTGFSGNTATNPSVAIYVQGSPNWVIAGGLDLCIQTTGSQPVTGSLVAVKY